MSAADVRLTKRRAMVGAWEGGWGKGRGTAENRSPPKAKSSQSARLHNNTSGPGIVDFGYLSGPLLPQNQLEEVRGFPNEFCGRSGPFRNPNSTISGPEGLLSNLRYSPWVPLPQPPSPPSKKTTRFEDFKPGSTFKQLKVSNIVGRPPTFVTVGFVG